MTGAPPTGDGRRWRWGAVIAVVYAALGATLGNAYPLFNLDMFSFTVEPGQRVAGPLLGERSDGTVHRAYKFRDWACDEPVDTIVRATCHDDVVVHFRFRRLDHRHMTVTGASPSAEGAETVRLFRPLHQTYVAAGAPHERCEVSTCRATFVGHATGFYGR
ncbi:MAG: hypothetical protein QF464_11495 [Myxococcota bacterium]|nr:hypothetical protein [Myxococcota bacterium]